MSRSGRLLRFLITMLWCEDGVEWRNICNLVETTKKRGGLLNLISRCFEPVPPFIVSLTAAKKNLLGHSPPTAGDVIKKPLCDCLTSLCSAPAWWRWLRVYQRPWRATAWHRFTQETAWCELQCNEVRTFKDSSMRFEWSFLVLFTTK